MPVSVPSVYYDVKGVFLYLCKLSFCLTWPLPLRRQVNRKLQPDLLNILMEVSSKVSEATEETGFILPGDFKTILIGKVILEG